MIKSCAAIIFFLPKSTFPYYARYLPNIFDSQIPFELVSNLGAKVLTCSKPTVQFLIENANFSTRFKGLFQHIKFETLIANPTTRNQIKQDYKLSKFTNNTLKINNDLDNYVKLLGLNAKYGLKKCTGNYFQDKNLLINEKAPEIEYHFTEKFEDISYFLNGNLLDEKCKFETFLERFYIVYRSNSNKYMIEISSARTLDQIKGVVKTQEAIVTIRGNTPIRSLFVIHIHPSIDYSTNGSYLHIKENSKSKEHYSVNAYPGWKIFEAFPNVKFKK